MSPTAGVGHSSPMARDTRTEDEVKVQRPRETQRDPSTPCTNVKQHIASYRYAIGQDYSSDLHPSLARSTRASRSNPARDQLDNKAHQAPPSTPLHVHPGYMAHA